MLYAINVLKKIIMKEKSYILFWKVKKMWILKHVCLQSTPWTMFCLMKSLCYYCPTFVIPVFLTFSVTVLFSNALSSIFFNSSKSTVVIQDFAYSTCAKAFFPGMFFVFFVRSMFSSLIHLHNLRSSSSKSSSSSKTAALHTTTLTAWILLIVCFFLWQ